jgi:hypothetical protein
MLFEQTLGVDAVVVAAFERTTLEIVPMASGRTLGIVVVAI